ncbi:FliM/FliN family flagellar motor switch protein [Poseidonibacter sp.]|uniref:FliM/FliN family flagellar motor switch protein n=1 Tax=Poseidonibacter sp. TaxID=2321188 RepID=UPI00359E8975
MSSDLSNLFKSELSNTLEQLLSKSSIVETVSPAQIDTYSSTQFIECNVNFDFKDISSTCLFFIPTISAVKFEYFMLGGMGDLKEHIDDEITDAVNEIVSNICGSFSTTVNAQGFDDIKSLKSEIKSATIVEGSKLNSVSNLYEFMLSLDNEKLPIILSFDERMLPFFSAITGVESVAPSAEVHNVTAPVFNELPSSNNVESTVKTPKNLELLYSIKLKLSVRLGTKVVLLKDILTWDVGEIIELEQMVNEPLEILVNGVKIGEGEAVIVEGKFGLKVRKIGNASLRLNQIGL